MDILNALLILGAGLVLGLILWIIFGLLKGLVKYALIIFLIVIFIGWVGVIPELTAYLNQAAEYLKALLCIK